MKIGIIGNGKVGQHLAALFSRVPEIFSLIIFDKNKPRFAGDSIKNAINDCDVVFVAVPTPMNPDGSCDLSAVEEVVSWVRPPMCIKSTVVPGTIDRLITQTGKRIVFSPEYVGETPFHKSHNENTPDLVVMGGDPVTSEIFFGIFRTVLGPEPQYMQTDAKTAELVKYMENCFFATKVAFVAQFYLLAQKLGASFNQMREIWVADTRVGKSHSTVVGTLGFGGRCLPKDLRAIINTAQEHGINVTLLEAVQQFNTTLKKT